MSAPGGPQRWWRVVTRQAGRFLGLGLVGRRRSSGAERGPVVRAELGGPRATVTLESAPTPMPALTPWPF